jgi:hypothetical protein
MPDPALELKATINHALTAARMVLPGAQALLGFPFIMIWLEDFGRLPLLARQLHLLSLALVTMAAILLMVPPANHRLARREEHTEAFYRIASWIILGALALVGLGIATDFFTLTEKVVHSIAFSLEVVLALLILSYALWFAWAICRGAANHTS